jgi:hypothetical protein
MTPTEIATWLEIDRYIPSEDTRNHWMASALSLCFLAITHQHDGASVLGAQVLGQDGLVRRLKVTLDLGPPLRPYEPPLRPIHWTASGS